MTKAHDAVYKIDSTGKVRVYFIEQEDEKYRMVTGVKDGKEVRSKHTTAKAKNVGRSNETTPIEQATAEIQARYTKKLNEGGQKIDAMGDGDGDVDANDFAMIREGAKKKGCSYKK